jgi:hypothetical protein
MKRLYRNNRRNRMNYINLANGDYKETTRDVGWVIKDGKWWADYADKLEWYQKEDGYWIQRYIKEKIN